MAGPYEVTTAEEGNAGVALVVSQKWAFAIVDLLLPGWRPLSHYQADRPAGAGEPTPRTTGRRGDPDEDGAQAHGCRSRGWSRGCGDVLCKHREESHKIVIVNLAGGGDPYSDLANGARLAT